VVAVYIIKLPRSGKSVRTIDGNMKEYILINDFYGLKKGTCMVEGKDDCFISGMSIDTSISFEWTSKQTERNFSKDFIKNNIDYFKEL